MLECIRKICGLGYIALWLVRACCYGISTKYQLLPNTCSASPPSFTFVSYLDQNSLEHATNMADTEPLKRLSPLILWNSLLTTCMYASTDSGLVASRAEIAVFKLFAHCSRYFASNVPKIFSELCANLNELYCDKPKTMHSPTTENILTYLRIDRFSHFD